MIEPEDVQGAVHDQSHQLFAHPNAATVCFTSRDRGTDIEITGERTVGQRQRKRDDVGRPVVVLVLRVECPHPSGPKEGDHECGVATLALEHPRNRLTNDARRQLPCGATHHHLGVRGATHQPA